MILIKFALFCLCISFLLAIAEVLWQWWEMRRGDPDFEEFERNRFLRNMERMNK